MNSSTLESKLQSACGLEVDVAAAERVTLVELDRTVQLDNLVAPRVERDEVNPDEVGADGRRRSDCERPRFGRRFDGSQAAA